MKAVASLSALVAFAVAGCGSSPVPIGSAPPIASAYASAATPSQPPIASAYASAATPSQPSIVPSPSPSAPVALVADSANGFSFDRPANWKRWQPNQHDPITSGPLVYLSTDELLPSCAVAPDASPNPPDGQGYACTWPLVKLERDGVLLVAYTTRILAPLPTAGGDQIQVNGASTQLQTAKPGSCGAIGADETLDVILPIGQRTPWSNIGVVACLRGPNLALAEAQVKAMLASLSVAAR